MVEVSWTQCNIIDRSESQVKQSKFEFTGVPYASVLDLTLIHIRHPEEDWVAICDHQAAADFTCCVASDVVICEHRTQYGHA